MDNIFLVRLNDSADEGPNFYTSTKNGRIFGSPYPGSAFRMTYDAAIALCQQFQNVGYEQACVTDRFGALPDAADLVTAKQSLLFIVTFSNHYFTGVDKNGRELGSRDRKLASEMSKAAALTVAQKLKRAGHLDATISESRSSQSINLEDELEQLWPSSSHVNNQ